MPPTKQGKSQKGGPYDHSGQAYQRKLSLPELTEFSENVSEARCINGCSGQYFYDVKQAYEERGLEGLREKSRSKPCLKNQVAPEVEDVGVTMTIEYPS